MGEDSLGGAGWGRWLQGPTEQGVIEFMGGAFPSEHL